MDSANTDWSTRPYVCGDELALSRLYERCYARPIPAAHWGWKLRGLSDFGENVWVATSGERVIGHYAGIPVRVSLCSEKRWAIVAIDAMVDPSMRRRGVMTALATTAHSVWKNAGAAFVLGLPNEQWGSLTGSLGWQPLFPLRWLVRPLRPEVILARRLAWPALARLRFSSVAGHKDRPRLSPRNALTLSRSTEIPQAVSPQDFIYLVRDEKWLQYRYLDCPSHDYELMVASGYGRAVGYGVFRLDEHSGRVTGYVADVVTNQETGEIRRHLIDQIAEELLAHGAETALTLAAPGSALYQALRRAGFWPRRAAFRVCIIPLTSDLDVVRMRRPRNWHIAGGDFDVI